MNNAWDRLLDVINDDTETDDYDIKMDACINSIETIEPPEKADIKPSPMVVEAFEFDRKYNMINREVCENIISHVLFTEDSIFSEPICTTITTEGFISNVYFNEEELIKHVHGNTDVVRYKCNYGDVTYEYYTPPIPKKTSNRGRKKKSKAKKNRKKQGDGSSFNSQITWYVRSRHADLVNGREVPSDSKLYLFKIFRNGKLQLPGAHRNRIEDIVECARIACKQLNEYLHPDETDIRKCCHLVNFNPVMINYKFRIKIGPDNMLDLVELKRILREQKSNPDPGTPDAPKIFDVKYDRQDTKLSVKFHTPIARKKKKKLRVNVFMFGKINILGGLEIDKTQAICDYLHWLFETYYDKIVVVDGSKLPDIPDPPKKQYCECFPITNDDYNSIMEFVDEVNAETEKNALEELKMIFG